MNNFIQHTRFLALFLGLACFSVNSWGMINSYKWTAEEGNELTINKKMYYACPHGGIFHDITRAGSLMKTGDFKSGVAALAPLMWISGIGAIVFKETVEGLSDKATGFFQTKLLSPLLKKLTWWNPDWRPANIELAKFATAVGVTIVATPAIIATGKHLKKRYKTYMATNQKLQATWIHQRIAGWIFGLTK